MWLTECVKGIRNVFWNEKRKDQIKYLEDHLKQAREKIRKFEGTNNDEMVCGHPTACMQSDQCGMAEHDFCGWCADQADRDDYEKLWEKEVEKNNKLMLIVKEYIREHPEKGLEI